MFSSTESLGEQLRKLREEKKLPLRKVAALLDIDVAILSKMERGERKLNREIVLKLAELYKQKPDDVLTQFLSEKILYELGDEELGMKALQLAEEKLEYKKALKLDRSTILKILKEYFTKDKRVIKAWIFGSFARGEDTFKSDIDVLVKFDEKQRITLFDFADIQYSLEELTGKKIDLAEEGTLRPFAWETAKNDLRIIYER